jgi:hypothetical protein
LEVTLKAIRSIGTNGIKLYLSKLRQPDRPLKDKIQKKAFAVGLQRFLFADVTAEREQAVTALILLKPLPPTAIQDLLVLSANSNPGISNAARCVLTTEVKKLPIMEPTLRPHFDWTPTPDSNFP